MKPDLEKLEEMNTSLKEKEIEAKKDEEERRQKKALEEYEAQKAKLDKAMELDILTQEEYDEKLAVIKKKYDNYEQLRKIDMQLQMGIISKEEHKEKIKNIIG